MIQASGLGSVPAEAARQLRSWGSQVKLEEELEMGAPPPANSSDPNEEPMLSAPDSKELVVVMPDAVTAFCDLSSDHTSGLLLSQHESLEHERPHLFTLRIYLLGFMSTTQASGVNALNCWPAWRSQQGVCVHLEMPFTLNNRCNFIGI